MPGVPGERAVRPIRLIPVLPFAKTRRFLHLNGAALAPDRLALEELQAECLRAWTEGARILFPANVLDHPGLEGIVSGATSQSIEWGIQVYPEDLESLLALKPDFVELVLTRPCTDSEDRVREELRSRGIRVHELLVPTRLANPLKLMGLAARGSGQLYFPRKVHAADPYLGVDEIAHWIGLYSRNYGLPPPSIATHWLDVEPELFRESDASRVFRESLDLALYWSGFDSFGKFGAIRRVLRVMAMLLDRVKWWRK